MRPTSHRIFDVFVKSPSQKYTAKEVCDVLKQKRITHDPKYVATAIGRLASTGLLEVVYTTGTGANAYRMPNFLKDYFTKC